VLSIDSSEKMFDYVDADMVTTDMGGSLEFDAQEWTQNRAVCGLVIGCLWVFGLMVKRVS